MRKDPTLRVDAAYLASCPPKAACNWLREKAAVRNGEIPPVLEYILLRRRDDFIDLGLAQYGRHERIRQHVYDRGNLGVRCAVWLNPDTYPLREPTFWKQHTLTDLSPDFYEAHNLAFPNKPLAVGTPVAIATRKPVLKELVLKDRRAELQAIAKSAKGDVLLALLTRSKAFEGLSDDTYRYCLVDIGQAKKLQWTEEDWSGGEAHHQKGLGISAAWNLTKMLPATEQWAEVLFYLLESAPAEPFEGAHDAIQRWKIDGLSDDYKEQGIFALPYSLELRSLIARTTYRDDDEANFRASDDLALRLQFYARFNPHKPQPEDWADFAEIDGVPCFEAMCRNIEIWETSSLRQELKKLGETLDRKFPLFENCRIEYERQERIMKEAHPAWFQDQHPQKERAVSATETELARIVKENVRKVIFEIFNFKTLMFYIAYALVIVYVLEYIFRVIRASFGE